MQPSVLPYRYRIAAGRRFTCSPAARTPRFVGSHPTWHGQNGPDQLHPSIEVLYDGAATIDQSPVLMHATRALVTRASHFD
jgi:hypothetical protein